MSVGYKILAALMLAAACVVGYIWWHGHVYAEGDAAGYARRDAEQAAADNKALKAALADVERLNKVVKGISDDAKRDREAAAVSAAAAHDSGERLRAAEARLRAAIRATESAQAATAAGSAATDAAEGVLADVQRRLDEAQERVAGFATESHRAGLSCERAYDALK